MKDNIKEQNQKFLKIANSSCNILSGLVEDILDHAKIEAGMFEVQQTNFYSEELLCEVHEIFELQTKRKNINLQFDIENSLRNLEIKTDKQRLKQVLLNLISNALKFTDKGSIKVKLEKCREGLAKNFVCSMKIKEYLEADLSLDSFDCSFSELLEESKDQHHRR